MWHILDKERRCIFEDFETREEADAALKELVEEDPLAEHVLAVVSTGEGRLPNPT